MRDGGTTALRTADTVDSVDTADMAYTVNMVYTSDMVHTIQTAVHCLNISTYAYIYC